MCPRDGRACKSILAALRPVVPEPALLLLDGVMARLNATDVERTVEPRARHQPARRGNPLDRAPSAP
jgi:hypothetical protein